MAQAIETEALRHAHRPRGGLPDERRAERGAPFGAPLVRNRHRGAGAAAAAPDAPDSRSTRRRQDHGGVVPAHALPIEVFVVSPSAIAVGPDSNCGWPGATGAGAGMTPCS
jgi:hypothetical protein